MTLSLLQGLEYLRTPGEAPGPSSTCAINLREAADVFILLPSLSPGSPAPLPVASVHTSRLSLTVILPSGSLAPGPLVPAGPWALTAYSPSEGAHSSRIIKP